MTKKISGLGFLSAFIQFFITFVISIIIFNGNFGKWLSKRQFVLIVTSLIISTTLLFVNKGIDAKIRDVKHGFWGTLLQAFVLPFIILISASIMYNIPFNSRTFIYNFLLSLYWVLVYLIAF